MPRLKLDMRPSTFHGYTSLWRALKPFCPDSLTRDVRTKHVQAVLDQMARTDRFGKRSLQHAKFFLSGAFGLAIPNDYYTGGNPVTETKIPAKVRGAGQTGAYSLEEVFAMLDVVPEPGRTMLAVGAFTALRRGEIRGLRWEDYRAGELHVERSVWNGISTDPKTEESKNAVPDPEACSVPRGPSRAAGKSCFRLDVPNCDRNCR
jgi:integrase